MLISLKRLSKSLPALDPHDFDDIIQDTWVRFDEKIMRPHDYDGLDFDLSGFFTRSFVKSIPNEYLPALLATRSTTLSTDESRNRVFQDLFAVARRSDEYRGLVEGVIQGETQQIETITTCLGGWLDNRLPEQVVKDLVLKVAHALKDSTDEQARFLRWMTTTVEFSARNWSRAKAKRDTRSLQLDSRKVEPWHVPKRGVSSLLGLLSRQTARVVEEKMDGASERGIARAMGRSVHWVRKKLKNARNALSDLLGGRESH